ncbi:hypothetical protein EON83_22250 [bacterium]|nr:MAG: hypothetical protein EON83_22250 [bacterium]
MKSLRLLLPTLKLVTSSPPLFGGQLDGKLRAIMRIGVLVALVCSTLTVAHAQAQTPAKAQTPLPAKSRVNPEAIAALDAVMARYKALDSYSDKFDVRLENADKWKQQERDNMTFAGTLAFERPDKLRLEGKTPKGAFLLVNDGKTTRILNPNYTDLWAQRPQSSPISLWPDFTRSNVALPAGAPMPIDAGWQEVGVAPMVEDFMFRPQTLLGERDQIVEASFDADGTIDGQECRVVKISTDYGAANVIKSRLYIAKSDELVRRLERDFGEGGQGLVMVENHSQIHADTAIPPETWNFAAPANVKPSVRIPDLFPATDSLRMKIGASLPVFSQDDINGEPLELNPKAEGVTILYFFFVNLASADSASLQRLQMLLKPHGLHVFGTAGDSKPERVQALITKNKLSFPIYFDPKAYQNQLATTMTVGGWPLVLLFDREAKLRAISQRPGEPDFVQALHQQFPDIPEQTIIDALMGPIP